MVQQQSAATASSDTDLRSPCLAVWPARMTLLTFLPLVCNQNVNPSAAAAANRSDQQVAQPTTAWGLTNGLAAVDGDGACTSSVVCLLRRCEGGMAASDAWSGKIFISYRRTEASWAAHWLADRLAAHFGAGMVFQDVDSIQPGDDFAAEIEAAVGACSVLIAVIGPQWLSVERDATRRLDDPKDWVRLVEAAFRRRIRVIPVLVDEARMPSADELPSSLRDLARKQAVTLNTHSPDTRRLVSALETALPRKESEQQLRTPDPIDSMLSKLAARRERPRPQPGRYDLTDNGQAMSEETGDAYWLPFGLPYRSCAGVPPAHALTRRLSVTTAPD